MAKRPDPEILEWAVNHDRILITHDRKTMEGFFYARAAEGRALPGLFLIRPRVSVQAVADEIIMMHCCSEQDEWTERLWHIPR